MSNRNPTLRKMLSTDGLESDRLLAGPTSGFVSGYHLSFTAASLRPELARVVAENFLALGDWALVKDRILTTNALQCRSVASGLRLEAEMRRRLGTLTHDQLGLLAQATTEDRTAIAWLATCKRTQFVFEFATEVLRDKLAAHDAVLRPSDYESYVENKSLPHPELLGLKPSSKSKIRQVLHRMLFEAGLLSKGTTKSIQRPTLSPSVLRGITDDNPQWLAAFLVPDSEIPRRSPS